jgi:FkbM family methyltransferase
MYIRVNIMTFYSQTGQDDFLEKQVFKGYKAGVFVDVGAHDGVTINNTLFFEKEHMWTGINIEPIKNVYDRLVINRPHCINVNCAVSSTDGEAEFICNSGYTEMLSGLKQEYDPRHLQRLNRELKTHGGTMGIINVPTKRLSSLFHEHSLRHVHYLSIDVEGAEDTVIRSIDFDTVFIDVIGFESNYDNSSIKTVEYLKAKGYLSLKKQGADIFMIHKDSPFRPHTH